MTDIKEPIKAPNLNPPDPKGGEDYHPFLVSELPSLNSKNWVTLKYYSQTTVDLNIEEDNCLRQGKDECLLLAEIEEEGFFVVDYDFTCQHIGNLG